MNIEGTFFIFGLLFTIWSELCDGYIIPASDEPINSITADLFKARCDVCYGFFMGKWLDDLDETTIYSRIKYSYEWIYNIEKRHSIDKIISMCSKYYNFVMKHGKNAYLDTNYSFIERNNRIVPVPKPTCSTTVAPKAIKDCPVPAKISYPVPSQVYTYYPEYVNPPIAIPPYYVNYAISSYRPPPFVRPPEYYYPNQKINNYYPLNLPAYNDLSMM